jgi:universal stress protein E
MKDVEMSKIVVGVQLSNRDRSLGSGSRLALEQARWLARGNPAHVTLLHSTRFDEHWDADEEDFIHVDGTPTLEAKAALEDAAASLRADAIEVEIACPEETAALAITRRVLAEQVDLVIVGKRADADHDGRRIGSVSAKLLRECPCAVWVVKLNAVTAPRTIVAATDLTSVGTRVVRAGKELARRSQGVLHVVHALQLTLSVQMEGGESQAAYLKKLRDEAIARIQADLGESFAGAELHVGVTSPTRALLECEARLDPDLIVMGTVSRGGVPGLLIGNTAERLLGRLDCSILTVKPEDFVCPAKLS